MLSPNDDTKSSRIKEKLESIQQQLTARIEEIRSTLRHHGNKGSWAEFAFRDLLKTFLPRCYDIGHGEIINSKGLATGEIDVIITSQTHPLMYPSYIPGIFFIEGVVAIGEVKMILNTSHLNDVIKHAAEIKKISVSMTPAISSTPDGTAKDRYYTHRPLFLFAYESDLKLETVLTTIKKDTHAATVDGIFLLDRGCIINFGDGEEPLQATDSNREKVKGWQIINDKSSVLFNLFLWLDSVIPREGWEYTRWLSQYFFPQSS